MTLVRRRRLDPGAREFLKPEGGFCSDGGGFLEREASTIAAMGKDGPLQIWMPNIETHWQSLNLAPPTGQWNCQEESGSLQPSIGAVPLAPAHATSQLYRQTVAGWTAKAVGAAASEGPSAFQTTSASLDLGDNESFAVLAYLAFTNPADGLIRGLAEYGVTSWALRAAADGSILTMVDGGGASTAIVHGTSLDTIRPYLFGRNGPGYFNKLFTNLAQVTASYWVDATTASSRKSFGTWNNTRCPNYRVIRYHIWKGVTAEAILAKSTLVTLGWTIPY